ncbi:branched-chain amino acid ABC transporter permease [Lacisediminimonas sp.]|uniref:branched-chain amino acid ABC transporter permease n=1 Tax=Lacisediminimonas sp. TaxID=3060582 RepID=UPI002723CF9E|nr:branched-chain amino acid ABC transporter permease [Lacisediminimonas sp.]MDO8299519.1 branched-chain amino acid ABC transporter permease [Lacisediminimonas sp.]MDO9216018.1 branched-chain amino acid ABC transporter permease [Lacisediminimonas sp.]
MKFERYFIFAFIGVAALLGGLVTDQYLMHIGILILFYATLGISLNMVVGYVGEFSLGHTAFLGIGAYAAAILASRFGVPLWMTVPLAGIISAIFGYLIGAVTLRLQGPFFVIVTLAFAEVLRLVADNWVWLTNGPMGIAGVPQPAMMATASNLGAKQFYFYVALAIFAFAMFVAYRFVYSNAGRAAVAIRENRYVAQSVGIRPFSYAMLAFVLGALLAGLAGGFYAHYISFVGSEVFKFSFMITMIIVVLVGGKGTLVGPVVGAVLITLLEEYLREAKELRMSIFGVIVMLIVLFMPNGLMGFLHQRRERFGQDNQPASGTVQAANDAGRA